VTVHLEKTGVIALAGRCGVEEAEELQRHLLAAPEAIVDWTGCESLHAAVVQVLLAARPQIRGAPSSAFLEKHIAPLLGSEEVNKA
jgi:hypothetical protein